MSKIIWRSIMIMLATSLFSGALVAEPPGNYYSYDDLKLVAEITGPYFFTTGSAAPAFEYRINPMLITGGRPCPGGVSVY